MLLVNGHCIALLRPPGVFAGGFVQRSCGETPGLVMMLSLTQGLTAIPGYKANREDPAWTLINDMPVFHSDL